jgi:TonB-dependent receptor
MKSSRRICGILMPLFALILSSPVTVLAQSTGQIQGRVVDANTGDSLKGASVRLVGGGAQDTTDIQGQFTLSGVPAGEQSLRVRFVGYESSTASVLVNSGAIAAIRIPMSSTVFNLEPFTVTSEPVGQIRALNAQKASAGIVNYVSEESFGAILDGNIGQAIQRLPGLSVNEDQAGSPGTINIRGVPGEFNSFQIDGNRVPNTGFSNSFNTRSLAADGVTMIEVIKSPTPDMDGDAIGGIINVVTSSAFQREGREISVKAAAVLNEIPNNWGYTSSFSFSDLFSVNGGENNLGISFTLSAHQTDRYSENADQDWVQVTKEFHPELQLDQWGDRPVWFMESTHWEHDTRETDSYAFQASIDYQVSERTSVYFRPVISTYSREGTKYETDINIDGEFDDEPGGNTYALLTPTMGRGTEDSEGTLGWIGTDDKRSNLLYSFATGLEYEGESSTLTVDLFYSKNENDLDQDDEFNMEISDTPFIWEYTILDPDGFVLLDQVGATIYDVTDTTLMSEGEWETNRVKQEDEVYSLSFDWEKEMVMNNMAFTFKTGAKYRNSSQMNDQELNKYETGDGTEFPYDQVLVSTDSVLFRKPKIYDVDTAAGKSLFAEQPDLFEFVEDDSLEDSNIEDYEATDEITAAYLMGTFDFGRSSLIVGARFEEFKWDGSNKEVGYALDPTSGDLELSGEITTRSFGYSETFWLPGVHYRIEATESLVARASYNRSYARPQLDQLALGRFTDDDGNIADGNPDLRPATSDNFDLSLEYYTEQGGLYSIGFFYKDIQDFHYTETYDFDVLDAGGNPIEVDGGDLEFERPVNGNDAENYGLELVIRQPMFFLPGPLRGLIFSGSATFTESEASYPNRSDRDGLPLEGFSDFLFTAALDYVWGDFRARVDYRYRSDYIEGLGSDIESDEFYASEFRWDAEIAYQLRSGLWIFASVINITEEAQISYQGYRPFVEDASYAGRKWTFGVEYTF